ncbi:MAG: corrinoid protein [Bacillota bacterium]
MSNFESLSKAVIAGNVGQAAEMTKNALDLGARPMDILNLGLLPGMAVVGDRFKKGDMFVPEVLMAARVMHSCMEILKPMLVDEEVPSAGTVVIGTVKGDLHDIGKNLVAMMLESAGFRVVNLGVDVPPEKFASAVREHKPHILGMSALLTTTMLRMKDTIELLEEEGLRDKVKVIVGGAPVTRDFSEEIRADGYAPDAASAAELAKQIVGFTVSS